MNITKTIAPKSDQLNADDMIAGVITIKITRVSLVSGDQPVAINYEGDDGKPYKPCKSMLSLMIRMWGGDSNAYIGRSLKLYRDDKGRLSSGDSILTNRLCAEQNNARTLSTNKDH